jgi:hypothetical protein
MLLLEVTMQKVVKKVKAKLTDQQVKRKLDEATCKYERLVIYTESLQSTYEKLQEDFLAKSEMLNMINKIHLIDIIAVITFMTVSYILIGLFL